MSWVIFTETCLALQSDSNASGRIPPALLLLYLEVKFTAGSGLSENADEAVQPTAGTMSENSVEP